MTFVSFGQIPRLRDDPTVALQQPDSPRLAILNWMMPRMDGLEVCRRIRDLGLPNPPYLMILSAKNDPDQIQTALANASIYLEAVGHIVIAWLWLEQLLAAEAGSGVFYEGKRHACRFFFRHELPRTEAQFALL